MAGIRRHIFNRLLDLLSPETKQRMAVGLSKYATILAESGLCSIAEFELNGEKEFLKNPPLPLRRIIDGGANKGAWSALALDMHSSLEEIAIIEPNPALCEQLENRFLDDNRVKVFSMALDYRQDSLALSFSEEGDEHASVCPASLNEKEADVSLVPTTTIDRILEELDWSSIDLLKLDLEGFDYFAMLGARKAFASKQVSMVQFEVTRAWEDAGSSPCAAFRLLQGFGFQLFHIRSDGLHAVQPSMPHFSIYSNFLGIHNSVKSQGSIGA